MVTDKADFMYKQSLKSENTELFHLKFVCDNLAVDDRKLLYYYTIVYYNTIKYPYGFRLNRSGQPIKQL